MKIILFGHLVVLAELDEEYDDDKGIEVGVRVNPEWDSSNVYRSANTYDSIAPNDVCHSDEG